MAWCVWCKGSGLEKCPECNGTGQRYKLPGTEDLDQRCYECDGSGYVECSHCDGEGETED